MALCHLRPSIFLFPSTITRAHTSYITHKRTTTSHTSTMSTVRSIVTSATAVESAPPTMHTTDITTIEDRAAFDPHFLVISLGNPPPHHEGFHSAGHHALQSLQTQLQRQYSQPQFSSERVGKKAAQVSRGPKYTLLQCPTLMNISGPWVAKAWKEVLAETSETKRPLGLVVVHDDLEQDLCDIKTRDWDTSHRGHNGLKSIMASMRSTDYKESKWTKIRVGIGRPEARDHDTVSNYVLKPMSKYQKQLLSDKSGGPVLAALQQIEATWESEMTGGAAKGTNEPTKQAKKGKKNKKEAKADISPSN